METASSPTRIGVIRLGVTTGLSAIVIFILCWLGTLLPFSSPTHAYITLFTPAPVGSIQALFEGACWSLLFGLLTGLVFATIYNMCAGLQPRRTNQ